MVCGPALRRSVAVGQHGPHVGELRSLPCVEPKLDGDHDLAADGQRLASDEFVQRGRHPTLHRILDGHDGGVDVALAHHGQGGVHVGCGDAFLVARAVKLQQCGFGESS